MVVAMLQKKKNSTFNKRDQWTWHLMLVPGVLLTLIFAYLPMFGIVMAFQKYNPIKSFFGSSWVGLKNFTYVFNLPGFYSALWNTLAISFMKIVFGIVVPLVLALLINEVRKNWFSRTIQTTVFLPYFLSWVILGGIIKEMFGLDGAVNNLIQAFGGDPIMFLLNNDWFPSIIVSTDVWKSMGYNMVLFLAAITGIDMAPYESAEMDGAGKLKQCWYITLPAMKPIIILVVTLALGGLLNAGFDQIFMLYNPIVYESGDIIDTFVYRLGLIDRQYAPAAAMGLFKSVVSTILVGSSYYLSYKFSDHRIF